MHKILVRLFIKDHKNINNPKVRAKYGTLAGAFGIITNIFLCTVKIILGLLTMSQSILADGINNLTDAASSIVTIIGFKLSSAPADEDHPYGHERLEYITGMIVSIIILIIGFTIGKDSIMSLINKKVPDKIDYIPIIIMVGSILVKLWQSIFYKKIAKIIDSTSLIATSKDSLNDCISTISVIIGLVIYFFFSNLWWIDSCFSILVSIFILISGIKSLIDTINPLIGVMPSNEEVHEISSKILKTEGVLGIHDLVIHRYGKCTTFATVHIEVDCNVDVSISHDLIDNIEKEIKNELNVNLTAHLDPIDINNPETLKLKDEVIRIVKNISEDLSIHDFRVVYGTTHTNVLFDIAMPSKFRLNPNELRNEVSNKIKEINESFICIIDIDQLYVNYSNR